MEERGSGGIGESQSMAARLLKLMADYECFPLWEVRKDGTRNVSPDDLPITAEMRTALHEWAAACDRTLDEDYPPDSVFGSPAEEDAFEAEGRRLWRDLQVQLGAGWNVIY